jgi:hypothetical protein
MATARSWVLLEDPELGEKLTAPRRERAVRDCVAGVIGAPRGEWSPDSTTSQMSYGIGLLVLQGLLTRRVGVDGRYGAELLGAGDLLRPWQREDFQTTLPQTGGWQVLHDCRMAVLDAAFAERLAAYPEVTSALFARAVRRSRQLAVTMAIMHQPRVDERLQMLLWALADRWGRVHGDGVHLPVRLTHAVLAELIVARRPTVSKALGELAETRRVQWTGDFWLLSGDSPASLSELSAEVDAS